MSKLDYNTVVACENTKDSTFCLHGKNISNSHYIYNSENVTNSGDVMRSKRITGCHSVYDSQYVTDSYDIVESKTISDSSNIFHSTNVMDSKDLYYSMNMDTCFQVEFSESLEQCYCSRACKNSNHLLFCFGLENAEYQIFNKPVNAKLFNQALSIYQSFDYHLKFTEPLPAHNLIEFEVEELYSLIQHYPMHDEMFEWASTLAGYTKNKMYQITLNEQLLRE